MAADQRYTLIGADGRPYRSTSPGTVGGHRRNKLYGRLDRPAALRAPAAGGYVRDRVFVADKHIAVAAGYRPCATCLPEDLTDLNYQLRRSDRGLLPALRRGSGHVPDPQPGLRLAVTAGSVTPR